MNADEWIKTSCPACGRESFGERETCLYCGARLPVPAMPDEARPDAPLPPPPVSEHTGLSLFCPRCDQVHMAEGGLCNITVHRCPACMGIFLDGNTFNYFIRRQAQLARARAGSAPETPRVVQRAEAEETVAYSDCPVCAVQMARQNYAGCSGVIIDVCPPHGVWLDDRELQELLGFIATGGHDLAKQIDEEEQERERLRKYRESLDHHGPDRGEMGNAML